MGLYFVILNSYRSQSVSTLGEYEVGIEAESTAGNSSKTYVVIICIMFKLHSDSDNIHENCVL